MVIDTDASGSLFDSLRVDALTSPDQLRELCPQPNPNSLRKETDRLTEETRALIGCSSLVLPAGSASGPRAARPTRPASLRGWRPRRCRSGAATSPA
ncbi:hypothetical protein ABS735_34355 [Streptomyces sp. MMCC 100]|uniref:hypothetical protein n=1 Tax=Streptomyces sp. MMCC 100 TaxID=3163555 RepID=UPI00359A6910